MEVIHEYQGTEHRIVFRDNSGKVMEGRWASFQQLATVKGYYAASRFYEGLLPVGVFRLNVVPHTVTNLDDAPYLAELREVVKTVVMEQGWPEEEVKVVLRRLLERGVDEWLSKVCWEWFDRKPIPEQMLLLQKMLIPEE